MTAEVMRSTAHHRVTLKNYRKKEMNMSSKPKISLSTQPQAPFTQAEDGSLEKASREEVIRRRAYEIYLECGEQPGRELDDCLQAERELEGLELTLAT
jgi:hypothetical protein